MTIVQDKMAAAERLSEALRFETVSHQDPGKFHPQAFLDLRDFLEMAFPDVHGALKREVVNDYSLLYTWEGTDSEQKPILLMGHLDVVPVEPGTENRWTHPPFSGRIADGYIWGRGSMDDKVAGLGILGAVETLLAQGFRPSRTVYLAFGHDEEIGGYQGAAKIAALLRSRGVRFEYLIDEGLAIGHGLIPGIAAPVAMIGIAEKGRLVLELTAASGGGHASMPPSQTAIGILSAAIQKLEANPMATSMKEPVRQLFAALGPAMPFVQRLVLANLWLLEPLVRYQLASSPSTNALVRTTGAVTLVRAGTKENVLPSEAMAVVDHVRRVIDDPRIAIRQLQGNEPSPVSDAAAPSFGALAASIRQVFPEVIVAPGLTVAGTDTKHYVSISDAAYRFLPLRLGPEDLPRIHGTDERIAVDNYAEIAAFYLQLLRDSG